MDAPLSVGEAWAIMFAKQKVPRKVVPLGFDASDHSLAAYDAVPDYLAPFEAIRRKRAADPVRAALAL